MTAEDVADLGERIWQWRDRTAFRSADDIPRVPHEPTWLPAFDPASIDDNLAQLDRFRAEWRVLGDAPSAENVGDFAPPSVEEGRAPQISDKNSATAVGSAAAATATAATATAATAAATAAAAAWPVATQVDYRLLGSTLARAEWEWRVMRSWQTDANFLVSQIVGPYFDLLLPLPPFSAERQQGLLATLEAMPRQAAVARENLRSAAVRDLAAVAVQALDTIDERLLQSVQALAEFVEPGIRKPLEHAATSAGRSLVEFRDWLEAENHTFAEPRIVGRDRFVWYLRTVALIAAEPEELVAAAEQEYRRAVVWEALARTSAPADETPKIFDTVEQQTAQQRRDETQIREFYEARDLLSQAGYGHYYVHPVPAYVEPLHWFGVNDDLTDRTRPGADGHAFTPDPGENLPYFYAANARDPRLGIIHEGTHYQQLVRAWAHENPLRRHYYDSVANEGIAFYNEEMMLQAGLFDDAPHSRLTVHNFNRLRSLRVLVDINLATGVFTIDDAVSAFVRRVPMDAATAAEETAMYSATPGLAMSYLVGKLQVMSLLADALETGGSAFSFRTFHDWVWKNGNLPFSLQRWELLGDRSELDAIDAWAASDLDAFADATPDNSGGVI